MPVRDVTEEMIQSVINRRSFVTGLGVAGLSVAAAAITGCSGGSTASAQTPATADTATQIFTAALIAEDLAITTYFNILTGGAIQDPNLAGTGGTATAVSSSGSVINVAYLQAALQEEVAHAQLLRTLLNLSTSGSGDVGAGVPANFYFPAGTFNTLENCLPTLLALETAFIGAYMTAVEEFASMAAGYNSFSATQANPAGGNYTQAQLVNFAKVSAAILGVEAEHRALVRGIPSVTLGSPTFASTTVLPANNVNYEVTDGLTGLIVNAGSGATAAAALAPFLSSGSTNNTAFSLSAALSGAASVYLPMGLQPSGSIPAAE
jgi:hypothetical protein